MALLFILFPVAEIYFLFRVGAQVGIANIFFYLLATVVFGIGLIRTQGAFLIRNMQAQLAKGQLPTESVIHSLLIFAAGALIAAPGFISDVIGILLLLPGTRHIAARMVKRKFESMMRQGSVKFASNGFSAGFWTGSPRGPGPGPMRDVSPLEIDTQAKGEVIDITPSKKE